MGRKSLRGNQCAGQDLLWRYDGLNVKFLQLLRGKWCRALGHEILSFLGFWERNHVTDTGGATKQRHHAIEAESHAAMRGCAVREGLEHIAEPAFNDIGRDFEHLFENLLLQRRLVDTDTAAT